MFYCSNVARCQEVFSMSLPEMANQGLPRRQVLSLLGTGALGAMLAACGGSASSSQSGPYKGKFVIVSVGEQKQNDPLIQAIQKAHPGVQVVWRNFPSEQFTSLFSAASVAHDQIDIMDLNGQDLRRYAVSKHSRSSWRCCSPRSCAGAASIVRPSLCL